jgi:hypothetical protein
MTAEQALRFAAYEAAWCRDRDAHEALCLLFPPLLHALELPPMDSFEAERFRRELKAVLAAIDEWRRQPAPNAK